MNKLVESAGLVSASNVSQDLERLYTLKRERRYQDAEILCALLIGQLEKEFLSQKNSSLSMLYNERGLLCYKLVKFDEAVRDFSKSIHLEPSLAAAYYNRGTVHYRLGRFSQALEDMEKALALELNNKEFALGLEAARNTLQKETTGRHSAT